MRKCPQTKPKSLSRCMHGFWRGVEVIPTTAEEPGLPYLSLVNICKSIWSGRLQDGTLITLPQFSNICSAVCHNASTAPLHACPHKVRWFDKTTRGKPSQLYSVFATPKTKDLWGFFSSGWTYMYHTSPTLIRLNLSLPNLNRLTVLEGANLAGVFYPRTLGNLEVGQVSSS